MFKLDIQPYCCPFPEEPWFGVLEKNELITDDATLGHYRVCSCNNMILQKSTLPDSGIAR
ncbi:hypothetical protein BN137_70 [Cronobacter condimenti 1330]|uniref:Uncharacterized protein n=1 Tax=Cronobacter condimenti 1330 TaxID=1073999 RepID=K8A8Z6_9ENTR|nr:hypothetical protein BN137_70 [Cronobacter condimenti 1330]